MTKKPFLLLLLFLPMVLPGCAAAPSQTPAAAAPANDVFAGRYMGSYFGDDAGTLSLEIDERGSLLWEGTNKEHGSFLVRGSVIFTDNRWMLKGGTDDGMTFQGYLQGGETFSGDWERPTEGKSGGFDLRRLRE